MKKSMTLALAASMIFFAMAATPHRAMAASDSYLYLDGIGDGDSGGQHSTPPPQHNGIVDAILTFFGL
jgi:hypothetical protein